MVSNLFRSLRIACLTFIVSLMIYSLSGFSLGFWVSIGILLIVILTGIFFDIIGTAVTAASESPFHAMATDRVKGSKQAIYLIRYADRVANFCNDVVGDIAGTISGALVAVIIFDLRFSLLSKDLLSSIAVALIAALTVGGKAYGKSFAIKNANQIIFSVGQILALMNNTGRFAPKKRKRNGKGNHRKVRKT